MTLSARLEYLEVLLLPQDTPLTISPQSEQEKTQHKKSILERVDELVSFATRRLPRLDDTDLLLSQSTTLFVFP